MLFQRYLLSTFKFLNYLSTNIYKIFHIYKIIYFKKNIYYLFQTFRKYSSRSSS